jgi:hypothetical protein
MRWSSSSYSSRLAITASLCSIVLLKRPRSNGTNSLIDPLALVSMTSRNRVAAPPCSGINSAR